VSDRDVILERLDAQHRLAADLLQAESLDQVAPAFLRRIAGLLRCEAGAMWEVRSAEEPLRFVGGWEEPGLDLSELWEASRELGPSLGVGLPGRAWASGEISWIPELEADRNFPRLATTRRLGLAAGVAIPVPVGTPDQVVAVTEYFTTGFEPPDDALMSSLDGFGMQLAMFIARSRAYASGGERQIGDRHEAEHARTLYAAVVENADDAVYSKDLDARITSWNRGAERIYGYTASEAIGSPIAMLVPPDHEREDIRILERIMRGERIETYETSRIRKDGARIDVSLTVSPIQTPGGEIVGASVVARDVTLLKRLRENQAFLAHASARLDASLDPLAAAHAIADTAVPELAELCVIDLCRADGLLGDSVVAGRDPALARELEDVRRRAAPLDAGGDHPAAQALRAGRPLVFRDLSKPSVTSAVARDDEHLAFIRKAGYNSAAVVPMIARGRALGAISFLHVRNDRRYEDVELELLADLGRRAAVALDNALLYAERDRVARTLQRGLRPETPASIPGIEVAVVFEAAGRGIDVGGDFYDIFDTPDGWAVLIGDVAGKGSEAATFTAQIRHSIRALVMDAWQPDAVLAQVNELLLQSETDDRFASAILAKVLPDREGAWLALSVAGHPPALQLCDAESVLLGRGPLLGLWRDARFDRHVGRLARGDTLVLYTDGLLEAGELTDHITAEELAERLRHSRGGSTDELTDALRADALHRSGGRLQDDLVVVALRSPVTEPAAVPREQLVSKGG
jgi:PAS domain S-box-containing protein